MNTTQTLLARKYAEIEAVMSERTAKVGYCAAEIELAFKLKLQNKKEIQRERWAQPNGRYEESDHSMVR